MVSACHEGSPVAGSGCHCLLACVYSKLFNSILNDHEVILSQSWKLFLLTVDSLSLLEQYKSSGKIKLTH